MRGLGGPSRDLMAVGWVWVLMFVLPPPPRDIPVGMSQRALMEVTRPQALWPWGPRCGAPCPTAAVDRDAPPPPPTSRPGMAGC